MDESNSGPGATRPGLNPVSKTRQAAFIAVGYALAGGLWVILSDTVLRMLNGDTFSVELLDVTKDVSFVLVSAALMFVVLRWQFRRYDESQNVLRQHETLLREVGEMAHIGGWEFDPRTRRTHRTAEVARIYEDGHRVTCTLDEVLPLYLGESRRRLSDALAEAETHGTPYDLELELKTCKGRHRWVRTICQPLVEDGKVIKLRGALQDITDRKLQEREIARMASLSSTLAKLNRALSGAPDRKSMLDEACRVTADHPGFSRVWIVEWDPASQTFHRVAQAGRHLGSLDAVTFDTNTPEESGDAMRTCIREDRVYIFNDSLTREENAHASSISTQSVAAVPLHFEGAVWGALAICADDPQLLQDKEVALLQEMAVDISRTLHNLHLEELHWIAKVTLERREKLLSAVIHSAQDGFVLVNDASNIIEVNDAYCEMSGYTRAELLRMTISEVQARLSAGELAALAVEIKHRGALKFETAHRRKDGQTFEVEVSARYLPFDGGMRVGYVRNLTEQKRAESALRESEERFRTMAETIEDAFWLCTPDVSKMLYMSPGFERIWGIPCAQLYKNATAWLKTVDADDVPRVVQAMAENRQGNPCEVEFRIHPAGGGVRWINARVYPRFDVDGNLVLSSGFASDITARKLAESERRRLSRAVEQSPVSIVITDLSGRIEYVNPKFEQLTGYRAEEIMGQNPRFLQSGETPDAVYEQLWRTITSGGEWRGELKNRRKDGEIFWELASISPIVDENGRTTHYLAVKEDITERRQLEEQFRQSQKMEAIGQLAGGVAHDFNNMLQVIEGYSELMQLRETLSEEASESLEQIRSAASRAADLTRQLLVFSRRKTMLTADVDLRDVISNTVKMLQRILGEDIVLQVSYGSQPMMVHADTSMLDQVLLNLAVNARDAMPNGGRLTFETTAVELEDDGMKKSYVCLRVTDTGCGIPRHLLAHIFEPFFSTKEVGKGTGLGLATVYGVVQQHGGRLDVKSEEGTGTTFIIHLPRVPGAATVASKCDAVSKIPGGMETILLVEDEPSVRKLMQSVLKRSGYAVLTAENGPDAIHVCHEHPGEVQLLLTDVIMPNGMSGVQLAHALRAESPDLPVIFVSGYSPDLSRLSDTLEEGVNFITKPCRPRTLLETIRARLDQAARAR